MPILLNRFLPLCIWQVSAFTLQLHLSWVDVYSTKAIMNYHCLLTVSILYIYCIVYLEDLKHGLLYNIYVLLRA